MNDNYILDGHEVKKVDVTEWAKWFGTADRKVKNTEIEGVRISTVFLGLDHSFGSGPPLLFETLVFDGPMDGEMNRYSTWDQAEKGHNEMVAKIKKGI